MKNSIESHLRKAIHQAPIDLLENLKSTHVGKMPKHDYITAQEKASNKKLWPIPVFSLASVFIIIFIVFIIPQYTVEGTLYIDINPSIEISYNKKDEVLTLDTLKPEDMNLIDGISFKNKDLYSIIGDLVNIFPLKEDGEGLQPVLLLSVKNKDRYKGQFQADKLTKLIYEHLQEKNLDRLVLSQSIETSHTIEKYADKYNISLGKMIFIRNLIILDDSLDIETLVPLSIGELVDVSIDTGLNLDKIINVEEEYKGLYEKEKTENAIKEESQNPENNSNKSSIDENKKTNPDKNILTIKEAKNIALKIVNGKIDDIDLEMKDGILIYEVEVEKGDKEYEIIIDAYSGKILKMEVDD